MSVQRTLVCDTRYEFQEPLREKPKCTKRTGGWEQTYRQCSATNITASFIDAGFSMREGAYQRRKASLDHCVEKAH